VIFEHHQIVQILNGAKTETRRPVVEASRAARAHLLRSEGFSVTEVARRLNCSRGYAYALLNAAEQTAQRPPWTTGQSLTVVRKQGAPEVCRIKLTGVWRQSLEEVTPTHAQLEGFGTLGEFLGWWRERYGGTPGSRVWVLDFLVDNDHVPRLLASERRGDSRGYTASVYNALPDEPEAVPESWQERSSQHASERDHELRIQRADEVRRERSRRRRGGRRMT